MAHKIEFKDTEIGRMPKEWEVVKVGDIGEVITGTTPSTKVREYWGEGYPFVTPTDFSDNKYVYKTERSVTQKGIEKARIIPKDSVMVTCIASVGEVCMSPEACITNQQINTIVCNKKAHPHYVFYTMKFRKNVLKRQAGITTSPIIKKSLFEEFPFPLPPLPEQKKIAKILSTVDQAIEKVNEAMARTERLKKGLMQKLLTKGIGHKDFKDTEIGRIPKDWEIVRLEDESIADLIMGQSPPSSTYNNTGIGLPFLQGNAEFGKIYPKPVLSCSRPIKVTEENDILLSVRAPVGDVNISPFKSCIGRGLAAIRPKSNKLYYLFLFYYLKFGSRLFESLSMGSTFKAIRKKEIEKFQIPLPPLPEQEKIAEILSTVDGRLQLLREKKEGFKKIKKGLMNDLLTGKKRVKSNLWEELRYEVQN